MPSLWYDEVATVVSATRSWPELWRMLGTVDAVHALYYAGMHFWFELVGYSPVTLRLPSAVATGLAAGGLVVLGRLLGGRRLGVLAGLAMSVFPRVTWMGTEGRSYALGTALAVALTLVFVAACRRASRPFRERALWWAGYAVLAAVAASVFIYLALLVLAHGFTVLHAYAAERVAVLRMRRQTAPERAQATARWLLGWSLSASVAGLVSIPFALVVIGQSGQVQWIDPISSRTFHGVFVTQLFYKNYPFTWTAWALVALGLVVLATRRSRRASVMAAPLRSAPTLAQVAIPFAVVPTVALIVASVVIEPLYSPRYLTFTAPAVALILAAGVAGLARRRIIALVMACLVVLSLPQIVAQRMPEAKQESSWAEVAELIASERAEQPLGLAEAVIFGPVRRHPTATSRVLMYAYPHAYEGLDDFALKTPAAESGRLWEERYRVRDRLDELDGVDVVWLVTSNKQDWRPGITERLEPLGFTLDEQWNPTNVYVLRYVR